MICKRFQHYLIMSVLRSHTDIQIKCSNIYTLQTTIYRYRLFPRNGSIRHSIIDTRDIEDRDTQARTWRKAAAQWLETQHSVPRLGISITELCYDFYTDMLAMFDDGDYNTHIAHGRECLHNSKQANVLSILNIIKHC